MTERFECESSAKLTMMAIPGSVPNSNRVFQSQHASNTNNVVMEEVGSEEELIRNIQQESASCESSSAQCIESEESSEKPIKTFSEEEAPETVKTDMEVEEKSLSYDVDTKIEAFKSPSQDDSYTEPTQDHEAKVEKADEEQSISMRDEKVD